MTTKRKRILYIDEDPDSQKAHFEVLKEKYDLEVAADWKTIKQHRDPFDLLILDIMVHPRSYNIHGKLVESISFPEVNWKRTGVEFLKRLRRDREYEDFGLPSKIPVIVATAVIDFQMRSQIIKELGIPEEAYLEKPFTIDNLEQVVAMMLREHKP